MIMANGFSQFPNFIDSVSNLFFLTDISYDYLNSDITDTDTSITLTNASAFPTGVQLISIENEIILCSSRSGNTFTVETRGFNGTTPSAHLMNAEVALNLTAHHFNNLVNTIIALENVSNQNLSSQTINAGNNDVIDNISLSSFKSMKWFLDVNITGTDYESMIISGVKKNVTTVNYQIYSINGNNFNITVSLIINGSNVELKVLNSEASPINIRIRRMLSAL